MSDLERQRRRADIATRAVVAVLVVGFVATIALFGVLALLNRQTLRAITDCTSPGGHCYQRSQRQTAKVVVGIQDSTVRVVVAATTCQSKLGKVSQKQLQDCTLRLLSRDINH